VFLGCIFIRQPAMGLSLASGNCKDICQLCAIVNAQFDPWTTFGGHMTRQSWVRCAAAPAILLLFCGKAGLGQAVTGTLLGTVEDASQAVIHGVESGRQTGKGIEAHDLSWGDPKSKQARIAQTRLRRTNHVRLLAQLLQFRISIHRTTCRRIASIIAENDLGANSFSKIEQESICGMPSDFQRIKIESARRHLAMRRRFWMRPEICFAPIDLC
jgi:hypothetical protein